MLQLPRAEREAHICELREIKLHVFRRASCLFEELCSLLEITQYNLSEEKVLKPSNLEQLHHKHIRKVRPVSHRWDY